MTDRASHLPWLEDPPADFRQLLKATGPTDSAVIRRLAATALTLDQLRRLRLFVERHGPHLVEIGCSPLRLGIIANHTTDFLVDAIVGTGVRHGLIIEAVPAPYGQVVQSALDSQSTLAGADAVLVSLDAFALGIDRPVADAVAAVERVDAALSHIRTLRDGIRESLRATPVFQTLPDPVVSMFGSYDARAPFSPASLVQEFNRRLASEVLGSGDLLVDASRVAAICGLESWHDARAWHTAKLPVALEAAPLHAEHVCRVLAASRGRSRKCLVLDLDNTLWGGVVGDDGLEGLRIGQGDAAGEAFLAVQSLALSLRNRGVILAVCSKNEESNARLPFREHREMLLREEHIAVFVANWNDKATNLRQIATTLDIGTDALVFLDDNPAERAIVRRELPEVAVPEIGDDPALYALLLGRAGYFEATTFGTEDQHRAEMYRANAERKVAAGSVTNLEEYLASLDMTLTARRFDAQGRARISQLVNKSNQFNLTTQRYSEAQIGEIEADPAKLALQLSLRDRFGDNGMICVVIFDRGPDVWNCDTWLMSCRVLGRRVEEAVLSLIVDIAREAGASRLRGTYRPTPKNALVAEHFGKLGFECIGTQADGSTHWELLIERHVAQVLPLKIVLD